MCAVCVHSLCLTVLAHEMPMLYDCVVCARGCVRSVVCPVLGKVEFEYQFRLFVDE